MKIFTTAIRAATFVHHCDQEIWVSSLPQFVSQSQNLGLPRNHASWRKSLILRIVLALSLAVVGFPRAFSAVHPVPLDPKIDSAKCLECHSSDDSREFGGTGPIGPHGSKWEHILERRYELSQAPGPGRPITNLFPNPDLSANGPYSMCAKCHNLSNIMQNASFAKHALHINAGFSCSTCHSAHGVGSSSSNPSGQRLISFDTNVVAPNGGSPVTYNQGPNTCTLTCHNASHNPNGSVKVAAAMGPGLK